MTASPPDKPIEFPSFIDLFVVSCLLLFFELVLIRWISLNIRVVAYFSNVILISCFLGFGVGCILKKRRDLFPLFPFIALFIVLLCKYLATTGIQTPYTSTEYIFGGGGKHNWLYIVPLVFIANAVAFITLGQKLATHLDRFPPLRGYSINVLGSLVGTVLLAGLSFYNISPTIWFVLCALFVGWLLRKKLPVFLLCMLVMLLCVYIVHYHQVNSIWSPYNKIQIQDILPAESGSFMLVANDDYHQLTLNLSEEWTDKDPGLKAWQITYDFPYLILNRKPETVLVLGAGTGNDVAAALRNGVSRVDAVELDPVIYSIGKDKHPEHPYTDPRVKVHINDARQFLRRGQGKYDAIVLGWLDSHRLFANLSNVRQDNFVYTIESMKQVRDLLKDNGIFTLSFYIGKKWLISKIFSMLKEAFGHEPKVFAYASGGYGKNGKIFVISTDSDSNDKIPDNVPGFINFTEEYRQIIPSPYPTDDWPYLYYKDKKIHKEYLVTIAILIGVSALVVFTVIPKRNIFQRESIMFFFLGAAFLLLEVRNITVLAVIYGSTWLVISIVISMVLIMILFANFLVERFGNKINEKLIWTLLIASIFLSVFWTENFLPFEDPMIRGILTTIVVSLTFLFGGVVFARAFSRTRIPSIALGFNILGAVVGGLTEYLSLMWGFKSLLWIAMAFYLLAWILFTSRSKITPTQLGSRL